MAITLFRKRDFEGDCITLDGNVEKLSDTSVGGAPSSLRMTSDSDQLLLFTKRRYRGDAWFLTGRQEISALGAPGKGGRIGFGNTVASARITPFIVGLYINLVCADDGSFEGYRSSNDALANGSGTDAFTSFVPDLVMAASAIWSPFLVEFELDELQVRCSSKLHDLKNELYPLLWKNWQKRGDANVFLVHSLFKASGICPPVGFGRGAVVACGSTIDLPRHSDVLAHELGHYFGLSGHVRDSGVNLMTRNSRTSDGVLNRSQVEEVHRTLANDVRRKRLRQE